MELLGSRAVDLLDAFEEMQALQEEYGDEFETVMLCEEPPTFDAMMGSWWLRAP